MPTILLKRSNTPGAIPATANLTNAAGGAEVAVNTADKRLFTLTGASAVVELGTNPSSVSTADLSATVGRIGSATITGNLVMSNLTASTAMAVNSSKQMVSVTNTGTGDNVLATSPVLVTPNLGTPTVLTLTNATGLPIDGGTINTLPVARGGTGATDAGTARSNLSVPSTTGSGASGTWGISITGNAGTATTAGNVTGTVAVANGGTGATDAGTARSNLSVPSTTGSGASGTWGISITGNANYATSAGNADTVDGYHASAFALLSGATFTGNVNAPAFFYTSDARTKNNVETIQDALAKVNAMRGVTFDWVNGMGSAVGVIAQEVQAVVPQAVSTQPDGLLNVAYGNLVGVLIEAIKELSAKVAELEKK